MYQTAQILALLFTISTLRTRRAEESETSPFANPNGIVAAFLAEVADRRVPRGAKARLEEIRKAVAEGNATVDMALDIVEMFPNEEAA